MLSRKPKREVNKKSNKKSKKKIVLLVLLLTVLPAASIFVYWFPKTENISRKADLDKNGLNEIYKLKNGNLEIKEGNKTLWKNREKQYIQDIEIVDIDGDGDLNLIIQLVDDKRFGKHTPFWHEKNEKGIFSHLYVYEYKAGKLKSNWCSSGLVRPMVNMKVVDINIKKRGLSSGETKKVKVLEIKDRQKLFMPALKDLMKGEPLYQTNIWFWDNWGFSIYNSKEKL